MSKLLLLILIGVVAWGVYRISQLYGKVDDKGDLRPPTTASAQPNPEADIPPLAPAFEASLAQAKAAGSASLKAWLEEYGARLPEPKKSAIELDYCQMLVLNNPAEARRIYQSVKARTGPGSPLAARIKALGRTFE